MRPKPGGGSPGAIALPDRGVDFAHDPQFADALSRPKTARLESTGAEALLNRRPIASPLLRALPGNTRHRARTVLNAPLTQNITAAGRAVAPAVAPHDGFRLRRSLGTLNMSFPRTPYGRKRMGPASEFIACYSGFVD